MAKVCLPDPRTHQRGQGTVWGDCGLVACGSPDREFVPELSARQRVTAVTTTTMASKIITKTEMAPEEAGRCGLSIAMSVSFCCPSKRATELMRSFFLLHNLRLRSSRRPG